MNSAGERKTLADPETHRQRKADVTATHIAPLTALVEKIRAEQGVEHQVPYFDPADGGTEADILFVLEAPGPKARDSGFVSCDNPDSSARNMTELLKEAQISRSGIVIWNIVPWYLGSEKKIQAAKKADTRAGLVYLRRVTALLPRLKVIVFIGRAAQREVDRLDLPAAIKRTKTFHPSPQFVNRHADNRNLILKVFREIADL